MKLFILKATADEQNALGRFQKIQMQHGQLHRESI